MRHIGIVITIIALTWTLPACSSGDNDSNSTSDGTTTGVDRSECSPDYPPYIKREPEPEPVLDCDIEGPCGQYDTTRNTDDSKTKHGTNADCIIDLLSSKQPGPAKFSFLNPLSGGHSGDIMKTIQIVTGYSDRRVIMFGKRDDWPNMHSIIPFQVCTLADTSYLEQCQVGSCLPSINWWSNCHPLENGICPSESCINGIQDGTESDIDCGGDCLACAEGKACNTQSDCYTDMICE
ncbi:MAG TPA: hypothetical protein EYN66_01840, partial [Myxococcales bacterium]|nr:hypothetical protein [Myxococcales bacterium]